MTEVVRSLPPLRAHQCFNGLRSLLAPSAACPSHYLSLTTYVEASHRKAIKERWACRNQPKTVSQDKHPVMYDCLLFLFFSYLFFHRVDQNLSYQYINRSISFICVIEIITYFDWSFQSFHRKNKNKLTRILNNWCIIWIIIIFHVISLTWKLAVTQPTQRCSDFLK